MAREERLGRSPRQRQHRKRQEHPRPRPKATVHRRPEPPRPLPRRLPEVRLRHDLRLAEQCGDCAHDEPRQGDEADGAAGHGGEHRAEQREHAAGEGKGDEGQVAELFEPELGTMGRKV